jgi:hypothetical protein
MPLAQGRRIVEITLDAYLVALCQEGWCRPEDVPAIKAKER